MFLNVGFHLLPIAGVVSNILAPCAYRYQAAQGIDIFKGFFEICDEFLLFFVSRFPSIRQKNEDKKKTEPDNRIPDWNKRMGKDMPCCNIGYEPNRGTDKCNKETKGSPDAP